MLSEVKAYHLVLSAQTGLQEITRELLLVHFWAKPPGGDHSGSSSS